MAVKNLKYFILILCFQFFCLSNSFAQSACNSYFLEITHRQNFQHILSAAQEHGQDPHFWIEALRTLNEDPNSFPYAEYAKFGKYISDSHHIPAYKRHILYLPFPLLPIFRGSHVDLPRNVPQDKKQLAEFLTHFAHAIELHFANRNSFSFPLQASKSYLTARQNIEVRRLERLNKVQSLIEDSRTPPLKKALLKTYVIYSKVKTALKIQWFEAELRARLSSILPHKYVRDVHHILETYDTDILKLMNVLKALTQHEVHMNERTQKHWSIHALNGIFRFMTQPYLWQFTYWEPHTLHAPGGSQASKVATSFKYFVDNAMNAMRLTALAVSFSIVVQGTLDVVLIDSIRERIEQIETQKSEQVIVAPTKEDAEASYKDQIQIYQSQIKDLKTQLQSEQNPARKQSLQEEIETFEALKKQAQARYEAWKSVNTP